MKKQYMADGLLMFATLIWGTSFFVTKTVLNTGSSPLTLMTYRALFASIIILPIFILTLRKTQLRWMDIKYGVLLGLYIYIGFVFQTVGADFTTASKNAFLTTLNVVFVPIILFIFYKQKINPFNIIAIVIAFFGAFIMSYTRSLDHGSNEPVGDLLTFLSAIFWAIQIIKTGEYTEKSNVWFLMFIQFLTMFVLSFLTVLIFDLPLTLTSTLIFGALYLALFCTVFAFGIMLYAMKYTKPVKASIIFTFEGVFGSFFAIIFGLEVIRLTTIIGGALIFIALIVSETKLSFLFKKERG